MGDLPKRIQIKRGKRGTDEEMKKRIGGEIWARCKKKGTEKKTFRPRRYRLGPWAKLRGKTTLIRGNQDGRSLPSSWALEIKRIIRGGRSYEDLKKKILENKRGKGKQIDIQHCAGDYH